MVWIKDIAFLSHTSNDPNAMTEVLKENDNDSNESEDLEALRDLEELKDLIDEKEKESGKQSTWQGNA